MVNRAAIEREIVNALRAFLLLAGKSVVTDGTNEDLTGPMRQALAVLGVTPAQPLNVSDEDIERIPTNRLNEFITLAQYYAASMLVGNITGSTSRLGPRQESTQNSLAALNRLLTRLENETKETRGDRTGGEIISYGPVPTSGVWRPVPIMRPIRPTTTAPSGDSGSKGSAGSPDPDADVVIDINSNAFAAYDKVYVTDARLSGVAVTLPIIEPANDGKLVRVIYGQGAMPVIVTGQRNERITGLVANEYQNAQNSIQLGTGGESVLLVADASNRRWLVAEYEGPQQAVPTAREIVTDIRLEAGRVRSIAHNWGTSAVDVSVIDALKGLRVTLGVQVTNTHLHLESTVTATYIVTARERKAT